MLKEDIVNYFKNNPKGYWFKRKMYGWGWTPVTWQGWLVIGVFVVLITSNALSLDREPSNGQIAVFFIKLALTIFLLLAICYKKGEKPRWQWGIPKEEKEEYNEAGKEN